jgi:hypothetical protein
MSRYDTFGTDDFLITSGAAVGQALYLLSLKLTVIKCLSSRDDLYIELTYLI